MAGKGRPAGFRMGAEHRTKIANSKIFDRLLAHAEGLDPDMPKSEIDTGLALLRKVMPDLKAVDHSGEVSMTINKGIIYESKPDGD